MDTMVIEESVAALADYTKVSIAYLVESRLRVEPVRNGLGGLRLVEEIVEPPYAKDYDQESGEGPTRWLKRWDISHWGVLSVFDGPRRMGGAVVAWRTPGVDMLEGRDDLAALWDIRVRPEYRRRGIGSKLFGCAVDWARQRGCSALKVETHNANVPACRFYAKLGCELGAIDRRAYPDAPEEVQLLWYVELSDAYGPVPEAHE